MRVTHSELDSVIEAHIECDIPLYIAGKPGIGKSERVKDFAIKHANQKGLEFRDWNDLSTIQKKKVLTVDGEKLKNYLFFVDIRLSQKESSDLNGIPMKVESLVDKQTTVHMEWLPPLVISVLSRPECNAIVFFDELPNAPLIVQNAAYQFIHDRAVGEVTLSKNVRILGAGNRVIDKSNVYERPMALKNRFSNIELADPTSKEWANWARKKRDSNGKQLIDPRLIAFVSANPNHLVEDLSKVQEDSFRTPRTVAKAGILINNRDNLDTIEILASAQAGVQFGSALARYIESSTGMSIDELFANPEGFSRLNLGQQWFVIEAIPNWFFEFKKRPYSELIMFISQIDKEMALAILINCKNHPEAKQFTNSIISNQKAELIDGLWKLV